jgi:membrane protease YdiL (CAAX protease family)
MNMKAISGYFALLILSFFHAMKPSNHVLYSSLPLLMLIFPLALGYRVRMSFSIKDIFIGLIVSAVILLPYYFLFGGNHGKTITVYSVLFQLLSVSFPEEFFFRGYLQDAMGGTLKAVLFVSVLFSFAHLPRAFFLNDWMSLLSFFPSLIMGWLYMKTKNIFPGTIFHFFANLVYLP